MPYPNNLGPARAVRWIRQACRGLALLAAIAPAALAGENAAPVPRFVALRSDKVNMRTGPGAQYPIEWVYQRKDLPVEIVGEFDNWRKIRDAEGTEGWVHERMVTGRRSVLVEGKIRALYDRPEAASRVVARAEPGVIAKLLACDPGWCRVEVGSVAGWLPRDEIWGVYPGEHIP